jgi:hypothetical protein
MSRIPTHQRRARVRPGACHNTEQPGVVNELAAGQSVASGAVWRPEPGLCGSLLHPQQDLVPPWLADVIDGHLRPLTNGVIAPAVRVACEHIDWELAWLTEPDLFWQGHTQVSTAPEPQYLWQAGAVAAEAGFRLILDVHIEPAAPAHGPERRRDDVSSGKNEKAIPPANTRVPTAIVVHGAGVEGELPESAWTDMTQALTTCGSTLHEPRADYLHYQVRQLSEPGPPQIPRTPILGTRAIGSKVVPECRLVGDWPHTWWSYPQFGTRTNGCSCPAHPSPGPAASDFGPGHASA